MATRTTLTIGGQERRMPSGYRVELVRGEPASLWSNGGLVEIYMGQSPTDEEISRDIADDAGYDWLRNQEDGQER